MTYIIKKKWDGISVTNIKKPLNELTQKEISKLNQTLRDRYFEKEKPKKKKKDDSFEG
tara:strand:- start:601 stop:774 length:174 start_codon:yes stop_codon:yes gene_type:complete